MSATTDLIKRLRAAGLSQSEISRRTGIPQPRVSRWENDDAPAGADDALRLAELAREVLSGDPAPAPTPEDLATTPAPPAEPDREQIERGGDRRSGEERRPAPAADPALPYYPVDRRMGERREGADAGDEKAEG